jgi:hypothetical protein
MDSMIPEVVLYYSKNAFGTADAISFDEEAKVLRICDFKSGKTQASMKQLEIYAGLFCLEYMYNPNDILMHLRLYQNSEIIVHDPEPEEIWDVMDRIIAFDNIIRSVQMRG